MGDKQYIGGSINVVVKFWGLDSTSSECPKVKLIDVHPIKPLIVSCDIDNRVMIFDYNLKTVLLNASVQDMIAEGSVTAKCRRQSKIEQQSYTNGVFINERLSRRSNMRSFGRVCNTLQSVHGIGTVSRNVKVNTTDHSTPTPAKQRGTSSVVRQVSFADGAVLSAFVPAEPMSFMRKKNSSSFSCENSVLVLCDQLIVIYNYITRTSHLLTESDLGGKSPVVSAEFLGHSALAVGCADGLIRVWDCVTRTVCKVLSGHSKGPVSMVRALPLKSESVKPERPTQASRIRMVSAGSDGVVLIWDLELTYVEDGLAVEVDGGGGPTARLKESLGANGSVSRNAVHYDYETNNLLICVGDRKIKVWDLTDVVQAKYHNKAQSVQHAKMTAKRTSVLMSVVGGGSGRAEQQYAETYGLSCMATVKPGDKRDKRVDVSSFALLNSPLFAAETYLLCSKTNSLGIYMSRESVAGDDKSEHSSVVGGANEKSQRLQLLHEYTLSSLMDKFVTKASLSESLKEAARNPAAKVYLVRLHPTQPHLAVLATSIGVLVLSLPQLPTNALTGVHPAWGESTVLQFSQNAVKTVVLSDGSSAQASHAMLLERRLSKISVQSEDVSQRESFAGPTSEVSVDTVHEYSLGEVGGDSRASAAAMANKRLSHAPAKKADSFVSETLSSRPVFLPSPSGNYCAVHWSESMLYIVFLVGSAARGEKAGVAEVSRGYCLSLGWLGTDDFFLVKTPPFIASVGAPKAKRSSILGGMFGAEKDAKKLFSAELQLYQCRETSVTRSQLSLNPAVWMGASGDLVVTDLHSGFVVAMNILRAKGAPVVATAEVVEGTLDSAPPGRPGEGVTTADPHKTDREVHVVSTSDLLCKFYCLISMQEAKRMEAAAVTEANRGKQPSKTSKNKTVVVDDAVATEAPVQPGPQEGFALLAVGPVMGGVEAVRWDYASGLCAVLSAGGAALSILRLEADNSDSLRLVTVAALDLGSPVSLYLGVSSLVWVRSTLLVTAGSGVVVAEVSLASDLEVATVDMNATIPITSCATLSSAVQCSALPWSEPVAVVARQIHIIFRDGSMKKVLRPVL